MRLNPAEEGSQAGPQVVTCGFPGQPIGEPLLPVWSPKVFFTGSHDHPAFPNPSIKSSIVE
jgi:hypothetical protein